ncbi:MAG: site-2 protease family protein [bacterium]
MGRESIIDSLISPEKLADGLVWYVVFLFSTTLHEASHAFAAMKMGDYTAYHGGQVTLDPIPHVRREPFGLVVVPILSFMLGGWMMGWASAPYDPAWALRYPRRSAIMALAGPAANLLLVLVAALCIHLGMFYGHFAAPDEIAFAHITEATGGGMWTHFATLLSIFFSLNLLLFAFNLIPFPPLDGSGAVPLFLSDSWAQMYMTKIRTSGFAIFGLLIAWRFFGYLYSPLHLLAIQLLYPAHNYQ